MAKGFGAKRQTKDQFIDNFIKTSKRLQGQFDSTEAAMDYHRKKWLQDELNFASCNTKHLKHPLALRNHTFTVSRSPKNRENPNQRLLIEGFNGIWRIAAHERFNASYDFTISVSVGSCMMYHPEAIKHVITTRNGSDTYIAWKKIVNSEIDSLKELVNVIRAHIPQFAWSYTCCRSSQRLCEQIGISTQQGIAFLLPASYD